MARSALPSLRRHPTPESNPPDATPELDRELRAQLPILPSSPPPPKEGRTTNCFLLTQERTEPQGERWPKGRGQKGQPPSTPSFLSTHHTVTEQPDKVYQTPPHTHTHKHIRQKYTPPDPPMHLLPFLLLLLGASTLRAERRLDSATLLLK
jgi:hypothetical protein